jgi:hypothetical protein
VTTADERNPWRDMETVQNALAQQQTILLLQIDELDRQVRRMRWWMLCHVLLLLTVAMIVIALLRH